MPRAAYYRNCRSRPKSLLALKGSYEAYQTENGKFEEPPNIK